MFRAHSGMGLGSGMGAELVRGRRSGEHLLFQMGQQSTVPTLGAEINPSTLRWRVFSLPGGRQPCPVLPLRLPLPFTILPPTGTRTPHLPFLQPTLPPPLPPILPSRPPRPPQTLLSIPLADVEVAFRIIDRGERAWETLPP